MKKAHLNRMTSNAEFCLVTLFFISFPADISNLELDFEQLSKGYLKINWLIPNI